MATVLCVCGHKKRFDQSFGFCGQKGKLQLKFITGDETWVHQYYPEAQAQSMTWKHPRSPTIKNSRYQPAMGNWWWQCFGTCMVCFCWTFLLLMKQTIPLLIRPLPKKLKRAVQCKRPQMSDKRVLLLHDNARPHTAHATVDHYRKCI